MMKVRNDFTYYFGSVNTTWNNVIVGCAQSANYQGWGFFNGDSGSALDTGLDTSGATGLTQWFAFYQRYLVHGSKIKVSLINNVHPCQVTLVPTVGYNLGNPFPTGSGDFDTADIDPGELPYSRKLLMSNGTYQNGVGSRTLRSYVSIKKMLNVKDLNDVASPMSDSSPDFEFRPFVPAIGHPSLSTTNYIQPLQGVNQAGVYWNIVFQNANQFSFTPPSKASCSQTVRVTVTTYIEFSDRRPLET